MQGLEKIRIDELIPEQLRDVAQNLIDFLKVYYSEDVNPTKYIEEITKSQDIDRVANDDFLEQLAQTIAKDVPDSAVVQKTFLLKRLVDYYNLKGTNQSVIIFFQLFYDKVASVFEPWDVVLESSSNTIAENKFIRIRPATNQDPLLLENKNITLQNEFGTVLASGRVKRVSVEQYEEVLYTIHFDTGSTTGFFSANYSVISDGITYGTSIESLQSIEIIDGGSGFDKGDILFLKDEPLSTFQAKLISTDTDGRALKFQIIQRGNGSGPNVVNFSRNGVNPVFLLRKQDGRVLNPTTLGIGVRMNLRLNFSTLCDDVAGGGKNKGLLSNNIVIQDGNYYSKYTYDVKVQIPYSEYKDSFNNLIHPVGYNVFNDLFLENVPPLSFDTATSITEINTVGTSNFLPGGTNRPYSLFGSKMSDATPDEFLNIGSPHMGVKRETYSAQQSPYTAISNTQFGNVTYSAHQFLNTVTGTTDHSPNTTDYFMEDYCQSSPVHRTLYITNAPNSNADGRYLPGLYLSPRIIMALNDRSAAAGGSNATNNFPLKGKINGYVYYVQDTSPNKGILWNPSLRSADTLDSKGQWRLSYYKNESLTTVRVSANNATNFGQPLDRPNLTDGTINLSYNEMVNDDSFLVENR